MRSLKVVLVGDTKVGKSCILSRFVQGTFDKSMPATIGAAFLTKVVQTGSGQVRLQLWDTAGQEKFKSLAPMYYRSASVAVLVYDVTQKGSFEGLRDWACEIREKAPHNIQLVVIGNKIDIEEDRCISSDAGEELAKELNAAHYGETSAKTGDGITEIFSKVAELDCTQDSIMETPRAPQSQKGSGEKCC